MSETTLTADPPPGAAGGSRPVRLPPKARLPEFVVAACFVLSRRRTVAWMTRRHGEVFSLKVPVFGPAVTVADPQIARQLFSANVDDVGNIQPNLSRLLGSGSVFALDGTEHKLRRKLLTPPFHGKSIKNYEAIFEEETLREAASWPEGQEFASLEPMMRITLNVILRAVFGADGEQLDELRRIIPPWVTLGSKLAVLPSPSRTYGRFSPWGRLARYRRQYDAAVDRLIDTVRADPTFETRDELLTLLAAGHETTAATLAWTLERVTRHPEVLHRLVEEAATDDNEYRQATILEVQRSRTVIDFAGRHVYAPTFELGEWVIPRGHSIFVAIDHIHARAEDFTDPLRFDPDRYVGQRPPTFAFIPFGGGVRRCVGAAFANVEMDVVLRTVLRHFVIETTTAPDEKVHSRGVAYTPKAGGRVVLRRRPAALA